MGAVSSPDIHPAGEALLKTGNGCSSAPTGTEQEGRVRSVSRIPEYLYILHLSLVSVSREMLVGSQFSSWLFPTWNQAATQEGVSWKEMFPGALFTQ